MLDPGGGVAVVAAPGGERAAVVDAIRAARARAGEGAMLLIAAAGHDPRAVLRATGEADADPKRTLAAIAQGVIVDAEPLATPGAAVLALPAALGAEAAWLIDPLSRKPGAAIARRWAGVLGLGPAPDALAAGLAPLTARGVAAVGVVGEPGQGVVVGDELGIAPGALLLGAGTFVIAAAPGVALTGPTLAITDADGAALHTLDGRPALAALRGAGDYLTHDPATAAQGYLVAVATDPAQLLTPGDAPLVGVAAVDPDRGFVRLTAPPPPGAHVRLAIPEPTAAFAAVRAAASHVRAHASGTPVAAIWISSAARASGDSAARDALFLRAELGVPLLGILGAAELCGTAPPSIHGGVLALVCRS